MAFCGKCGSSVADGAPFCQQCGAPVAAAATPQPVAMAPAGTSGLQENVAGLLCYLLGWLTGIIFLLIDKRPFVRFHAAQSIVVFGILFVIRLILSFGFLSTGLYGFGIWSMISLLVSLVTLVAWIVLMVMAYQGKMFEVPIAAPIAKNIAGSTPA
ncbi:MAG TPA: zinc-ribbon domain-containing protein [Terracidiphilus sp.]|nr:zinc-ribbon domain-containing protein [Terracidiphilus sp.]